MASEQVQPVNHENELWEPKVNPWLIALAVIVPTFMEVLDTSIFLVGMIFL